MDKIAHLLQDNVVDQDICTACGACISLEKNGNLKFAEKKNGMQPDFTSDAVELPPLAWLACPGKGIDYPKLYLKQYGRLPNNWLLGHYHQIRVGYSADENIRNNGASGGILTHLLCNLLQTGKIDAAIVVKQGFPIPEKASVMIVHTINEIQSAAQSVYIPVPTLSILNRLEKNKTYAITCLPDQAAALRQLQAAGYEPACQIKYILGLYTGTALKPSVIPFLLRSNGISLDDRITSLKWRAGNWPGYLEIVTQSGKVIRSKKVYYNYLIPFFITPSSLQGMDFTNEFCDISVGDAWSPKYESVGQGVSVIITRTDEMEKIITEMIQSNSIHAEIIDPTQASEMHGHMIDFKKRGSYIRNRWREISGKRAPDFGLRPQNIPISRILFEMCLMLVFALGSLKISKKILEHIPESMIGPIFNHLRLFWKSMSKPTKRKGLASLSMTTCKPSWESLSETIH